METSFIHQVYCLSTVLFSPSPLTDAFSRLQEASVVRLLESLVGLSDEGGGPLNALLAAGYLLGEFPQPHSLGREKRTC